jgi:hypothetical protein
MLVVFKTHKIRGETTAKVFGKVDTFWIYQWQNLEICPESMSTYSPGTIRGDQIASQVSSTSHTNMLALGQGLQLR